MTHELTALKRIEAAAALLRRQPWSKRTQRRLRDAIRDWEMMVDTVQREEVVARNRRIRRDWSKLMSSIAHYLFEYRPDRAD